VSRILLFGAVGPYAAAFSRALAPHCDLLGCIVPRPVHGFFAHWLRRRRFPLEALGFACPVLTLGAYAEPEAYRGLASYQADLVVSVGFPKKLPAQAVSGIARLGAINVHPGALPANAGPSPLFWALKRGDAELCVTLHALSDVVDGGDIIAGTCMERPVGATGAEIFERLGTLGANLLVERLPSLSSGAWPLAPQDASRRLWESRPKHSDFVIDPLAWKARDLHAFVRGARYFGTPWAVLADDLYLFQEALSYADGDRIPGEFIVIGDEMILAVKDGTVRLRHGEVSYRYPA
jgi:methionyl-tRNA formyltransferase